MSAKSTLITFLAGAAAGAIAGILLAPDNGKNTRKKLSQAALDLRDQLEGKVSDEFSKLNEYKDKALASINKGVKKAGEEVRETQPKY